MNLQKLAKEIHKINVKKGFWDKKRNEGEVLFLIITELAEACEADRKSRYGNLKAFELICEFQKNKNKRIKSFEECVKDSLGDELADAMIRMLDYCVGFKKEINDKEIKNSINDFNESSAKNINLGEELLGISFFISGLSYVEFVPMILLPYAQRIKLSSNEIIARIIWLANKLNVPLESHIKYKMWYNSTRPKMHNKKY